VTRTSRALAVVTGMALAGCSGSSQQTKAPSSAADTNAAHTGAPSAGGGPAAGATLFERLGGQPAVTAVVDGFLKRVAADTRINGRFINVDLGRLRTLLIQFVSQATGAQVAYTGREMHEGHASLQIVDEEFDALVEDLVGALVALKVPAREKNELLGALGPLKSKIVNPPSGAAAKHDPGLAQRARAIAQELRASGAGQAGELLELAVNARVRGQRSYADQLFSAAERLVPTGRFDSVAALFREGAPERITTALKQMPANTPAQPKLAVGSSEDDAQDQSGGAANDADAKDASAAQRTHDSNAARAELTGKMTIEGGPNLLGVITLDPVKGHSGKRTPKQRIMEQRDRQFAPRLLAIPVGSTVSFPNFDPVFHNVFSLSPARSFDLGIFKNGEARDVTFAKEGLVRLGCNLHSNMAAHVVVVAAAHYVVTSPGGQFAFRKLTPGKYRLRAWGENSREPIVRTVDLRRGANTLDLSIARDEPEGPGTDKFGVPRTVER
jgi:hemoglobin